jgi:hypothetical protein
MKVNVSVLVLSAICIYPSAILAKEKKTKV